MHLDGILIISPDDSMYFFLNVFFLTLKMIADTDKEMKQILIKYYIRALYIVALFISINPS